MCGIAGILGGKTKKAERAFNPTILKYLMLSQDSRGRDNCGVFYKALNEEKERKNAIAWGFEGDPEGTTKTFKDFLGKRELLPFSAPYQVIAHSRKGSIGGGSRDNAHPFKCGNIIGVHNGTIRNWENLMEYLDVDITDIECDSEALFKAISEGKRDDLLKYHGGAATLVWTDLETGYTYLWVSGTKNTYDSVVTADRDFHIWQTKAGIYFSSESTPLLTARLLVEPGFEIKRPQTLACNKLFIFDGDTLVETITVDREPYTKPIISGNVGVKKENIAKLPPSTKKSGGKITDSPQIGTEKSQKTVELHNAGRDFVEFANEKLPGIEEEPKDSTYFRLSVQNGLYFRGYLPLHSTVCFNEPVLVRHVHEHRLLGYWVETRYYTDKHGYLYYYNNSTQDYTSCSTERATVKGDQFADFLEEVFFYNGVLLRDEAALIEMLELIHITSTSAEGRNLRLKAASVAPFAKVPVWENIGTPTVRETNKYLNFGIANHKVAKEKGYYYMEGYYRFPYTTTIYKFAEGKPVAYEKWHDSMFCVDLDGRSSDKFHEWQNSWGGSKSKWAYKSNGYRLDIYSTECPECHAKHKLSQEDVLQVPTCYECQHPITIEDEKYFQNQPIGQKA